MKIKSQIVLRILIVTFWTNQIFSQSPYIYSLPNTAHSQKLKKKGDLSLSIGAAGSIINSKFTSGAFDYFYRYKKIMSNLQLGYSPFKHFSISFHHNRMVTKDRYYNDEIYHKSNIFGVGIGTYYPFKIRQRIVFKKTKLDTPQFNRMLIDFHLGYSKGEILNEYLKFSLGNVDLSLNKYYLQGGLHYLTKYFDWSYMLKFGKVNYLGGVLNGKPDLVDDQTLNVITEVSNFVIWENSIRFEFKFRQVGLFSQITTTSNQEFSEGQWNTMITHFGLTVRFQNAVLKRKKHQQHN